MVLIKHHDVLNFYVNIFKLIILDIDLLFGITDLFKYICEIYLIFPSCYWASLPIPYILCLNV